MAKKTKKNIKKLPKAVDEITNDESLKKVYIDVTKKLEDAEEARPYIKRNVEGDASETGLVKFI